jgi:hypothetical protein
MMVCLFLKMTSCSALTGLGLAIFISETCEVVSTDRSCTTSLIFLLKAAVSITTIGTAVLMLWQLKLTGRRNATKTALSERHVRFRGRSAQPDATAQPPPKRTCAAALTSIRLAALRRLSSAIFVAANCVHTVPGLSGSFKLQTLGNTAEYRFEPVITVRPAPRRGCRY